MIEQGADRADVVIRHGVVIDGTGAPRVGADVAIRGDRIIAVGRCDDVPAAREIDATGRVVCPGFVDIHSHADLYIYKPDHPAVFEPLIRQGITSFLGGNCGFGLSPIDPGRHLTAQEDYLESVTTGDLTDFPWRTTGQYLDLVQGQGAALNMGLLCPHGLLRLQAMGPRNEHADADELRQMERSLDQALEQGCFGMSVGLQYYPGLSCHTDELVYLGAALARRDARLTAHMRSYTGNTLQQAVDEVAQVARRHGVHVQVSHIFALPWAGRLHRPFISAVKWMARHPALANAVVPEALVAGDMQRVLDLLDRYRSEGLQLGADVMPTTTGFTHLLAFFPPWVMAGGAEAIMQRLRDRATRARIIQDIERGAPAWPHNGERDWSINFFGLFGYECASIMAVGSERNRHHEGRNLVQIARERGQHPAEAAMDLLLEEQRQVMVFGSPAEPEDAFTVRSQYPALAHPEVAITTDTILLGFGRPSYLFYGCFPRFCGHHVRQLGLLDLETAIYKCTDLPARSAGFVDRGRLTPGAHADVVVFDPEAINTAADFAHPDRFPEGIDQVLINGKVVLDQGQYDAGALAGQVLRRA